MSATRAPKRSVPTKKGRFYIDPDDPTLRYLSVTNALSRGIAKEALVFWAAKIVAEEALEQLPTLVRMSRTDPDGAVALLKGAPSARKDAAAALGSTIHGWAERISLGQAGLADVPDDARPFIIQYLAFLEDFGVDLERDVEATEATVAHAGHRYAGTLDAIMRLPRLGGQRTMVDYKTSSTRAVGSAYQEYALQLAAYRHAEVLWLPDGTKVPVPEVDGAAILNLRADGYALLPAVTDSATYDAFLGVLRTAQWLTGDAETAIGERLIPAPAVDASALGPAVLAGV